MKKLTIGLIAILLLSAGLLVATVAGVVSAEPPTNAGEKAKSVDGRGPLEKISFIHYKKEKGDAKGNGKAKSPRSSMCYAFLANGAKWKTTEGYVVNPTNGDGMAESFVVSAFNTSVNTWDSGTSFDIFGPMSVDSEAVADFSTVDGQNVVMFADYQEDGVIAVTNIWGYFSGPPKYRELIEWDMILDTDYAWGDATVTPGVMDLQNIATHELGHSAGLGDLYTLECNMQTMYGYSDYGDIEKRTLESGDIAGITALYGAA